MAYLLLSAGGGLILIGVVEGWIHGDEGGFRCGINCGFSCALGDVTGLTKVEAVVFFDDVDAEE